MVIHKGIFKNSQITLFLCFYWCLVFTFFLAAGCSPREVSGIRLGDEIKLGIKLEKVALCLSPPSDKRSPTN